MHTNTRAHSRTPRHTPRRASTAFAAGVAILAALGLSIASASPALAHDELVGVDGVFNEDQSLFDVTLQFNNEIMDIGAETIVAGADGTDLAEGAPLVEGRNVTQSIVVPATEQLATIDWRVVSSDGHPIQGRVEVQFAGDGTSLSIAAPRVLDDTEAEDNTNTSADGDASGNLENDAMEVSLVPTWLWPVLGIVVLGAAGATVWAMTRRGKARTDNEDR